MPNINATIIESQSVKREKVQVNENQVVNECSNKTSANDKNGKPFCQEVNETDYYDSLNKQQNNAGATENTYDKVPNHIKDEFYSMCSSNHFADGHKDINNVYSHIENTDRQTHSKGCADIEDNVYNTLQLKTRQELEISKTVADLSDYNTIRDSRATTLDNGDYSHINNVVSGEFDSKNKYVDDGNIYYNDNEYASVIKNIKK
jgi:hypothetical protein